MITTKELIEKGVYYGHPAYNWNPKTHKFIIDKVDGIFIIDLFKTVDCLNKAYSFVKQTILSGGNVLFVGTKKQAQESIKEYAEDCGMPYISVTWSGGTLTNFETISKRVERMVEIEDMNLDSSDVEDNPEDEENINSEEIGFNYTTKQRLKKKEKLLLKRELEKLQKTMTGIRNMEKIPDAIFIIDSIKESIALKEAKKLGIPIISTVDTNADPDMIDYPIPANDCSRDSIDLIVGAISEGVKNGKDELVKRKAREEELKKQQKEKEKKQKEIEKQKEKEKKQKEIEKQKEKQLLKKMVGKDDGKKDEKKAPKKVEPKKKEKEPPKKTEKKTVKKEETKK